MLNMFNDYEIITNLRKIADKLEENKIHKNQLYAYVLKTGLYPSPCDCEQGMKRYNCKKCNGTGYMLVKENERNEKEN